MIRFFKAVLISVGLFSLILGVFSTFDSIIHNDYNITSLVSMVGFTGIGAIMLIVANQLKFSIINDENFN